MILVAVVAVVVVMITVIVAPAAATVVTLTRKIPISIPRKTERKGKKLTLKKNVFISLTNIKENKNITNISIRRQTAILNMINMIKIRNVIIEKEKSKTKIRIETVQDTVKYRSAINNHFDNALVKYGCITYKINNKKMLIA